MGKSTTYYYHLEARGYELDSYQHVNNAVYLNYMEQARWDILRKHDILSRLQSEGLKIVVAEVNTRYGRQIALFDAIRVETTLEKSAPFLLFKNKFFKNKTNQQVARAVAKTVFLDAEDQSCDIPEAIEDLMVDTKQSEVKPSATLSKEGDVGVLELNNPPQNVLSEPLFIDPNELDTMLAEGIKALVICGVGRYFSAGADLEQIDTQLKDIRKFKAQLVTATQTLNEIEKLNIPVVAAISGVCFGGGLEIAMAAHIRICNSKTLFAMPEVNHNLMPGMGGLRKLTEIVGQAKALELTLTGDMIDADSAKEMGLVDYFCEKGSERAFAIDLVNRMTKDRPLVVIEKIMNSLRNSQIMGLDEAIAEDAAMFCELAQLEQRRREAEDE